MDYGLVIQWHPPMRFALCQVNKLPKANWMVIFMHILSHARKLYVYRPINTSHYNTATLWCYWHVLFHQAGYSDCSYHFYQATLCIARSYRKSVCPFVCLSHSCTVHTWFDLRSWFLHHMAARDSSFLVPSFISTFQLQDLQIKGKFKWGR